MVSGPSPLGSPLPLHHVDLTVGGVGPWAVGARDSGQYGTIADNCFDATGHNAVWRAFEQKRWGMVHRNFASRTDRHNNGALPRLASEASGHAHADSTFGLLVR